MSKSRIPSYRHHKPSGQAVVTLDDRDFYLGPWNSKLSRVEYDRLISVARTAPDGNGLVNLVAYEYDSLGQRTAVIDALGNRTDYTYSPRAGYVTSVTGQVPEYRQASVTDANNAATAYSYDLVGNLLAVEDALGHVTSYQYDNLGRRTSVTDANHAAATYTYDLVGNLLSLTDPQHNTTAWTYDRLDRPTVETNLWGSRHYTYDALNELTSVTDRDGRTTIYQYDNLGRRTAENWLDDQNDVIRTFAYTYDAASQLISAGDPAAGYGYFYDNLGRATSALQSIAGLAGTITLAQQFDAVGNRTQLAATIGDTADFVNDYTYDALGQMTSVAQHSGAVAGLSSSAVAEKSVQFAYNAAGQFNTVTRYADLSATQLVAAGDRGTGDRGTGDRGTGSGGSGDRDGQGSGGMGGIGGHST